MPITIHTDLPHTRAALREAIGVTLGAASMCWATPEGAGEFQSERASALVEELLAKVEDLTSMNDPSLGQATTAQLVSELATRFELGFSADPNYRTTAPEVEHVTDATGDCWCKPINVEAAQ